MSDVYGPTVELRSDRGAHSALLRFYSSVGDTASLSVLEPTRGISHLELASIYLTAAQLEELAAALLTEAATIREGQDDE